MIINDSLIVKCKESNNLFISDVNCNSSTNVVGIDFSEGSKFADLTHSLSKLSHEPFDIMFIFITEAAYNKLLNNEDSGTLTPHCKDEYEWHQIR